MMIGWLETLLDYDFSVVHIPGVLNKLPDALSRLYPPIDDDEGTSKLVGDKHTSDSSNKTKTHIQRTQYSLNKALNVLAMNLIENKNKPLDYIKPPKEDRNRILNEVHNFGHFGSQAIVQEIHSQGLHWTKLYDEAQEMVNSCIECQRHNVAKRGYHPLTNIVAYRPFDHVALDLAGPLPTTDGEENYLFVLVDICTRHVVLRPLKNKQSDTIARTMISIFGDYGFPRIISSDNGLEFRNALQSKLQEHLGIDRRYTTPYHPRGNGAAEASVKIAINVVRKMCESNGKDWLFYLPVCQLAINHAIKRRTQSSPFTLMFARRVNVPDDYADAKKFLPLRHMMTPKQLEDRIEHMETVVFPAIAERTNKIMEERKKKFDKKNIMVDIPVGTHVIVRLQHRPNKLAPLYEGPYTVIRRNQGGSYELKDEQNELMHRNYVPSELKVVNVDESKLEDTYEEVESIRDHRGKPGNREYLIKWKGYGERGNTWHKAADFTDPNLIQKYWDKVRASRIQNEEASNTHSNDTNGRKRKALPDKSSNKRVASKNRTREVKNKGRA